MLLRIMLVMLLLVCGGCFESVQLGSDLPEMTDDFSEAMRWKDFATAAGFMTPAVRDDFNLKFSEDKDLYVVGSKFRTVTMHMDERWAEAFYVMEYYRLPSSRIKEWHWSQRWEIINTGGVSDSAVWKISETAPSVPWQ